MAALSPETLDVLDEILRTQFPKVRSRVFKLGLTHLHPRVRRQLRDAFADELMRSGFGPDWEPNARGLILEGLIDQAFVPDDPDLDN